jgi:hypothetical protein
MKTVAQLKTDIRADVWPSGEAENLVTAHNNQFQEAFAEICKWVKCEQSNNANVIKFCKTNYKMGMTVLSAPVGRIVRVFTVANEDFDDPVFYRPTTWPEPEDWARNLYLFPKPLVTDARKLPIGFQYSDAAHDSAYGRARTGIWAQDRKNLFLAPWIQSNELVVVEWDGIKEEWDDADPINSEIHYRKAVKLYMQFAHERDYGDAGRAMMFKNERDFHGQFDTALGDLIHECELRTRTPAPTPSSPYERPRLCNELLDDAPVDDADGITIADLGNISLPGLDLDAITGLVRSWGPNGITACGLIAGTLTDYDLTVGNSFHDYISPYIGNKGAGAETNGVWAVPSAADWTKDSLVSLGAFVPMPNNGRYYDIVIGDVHLFVIDSSASDPDGVTSADVQGAWLQAKLALSTAPWKVVKMERQPFGSLHSNADIQWPFADWGAHLVISCESRNYERLIAGGIPYVNNGLGGQGPIEEIVTPTVNTEFAYAANFGAGRITASTQSLLYEFFDSLGSLVDTLTLTKA